MLAPFDMIAGMFARIRNTPVDYAWGSFGEITRLLGDAGSCRPRGDGGPEAELWLGAHHGSPSEIVEPALCGGAADVRAWIAADPATTLGPLADGLRRGDGARLPFLVKVLAAGTPLSLQAHPSLADARAGFAREEAAGVALDAPERSYKDPSHKPELLLALSETMETLAGFREHADAVASIERLALAARECGLDASRMEVLLERVRAARDEAGRREIVAWLLERADEVLAVTDAVVATARAVRDGGAGVGDEPVSDVSAGAASGGAAPASGASASDAGSAADALPASDREALARDIETVCLLADHAPRDPGIVIALLLHRLTLRRGDAIFVGAGSLHAYLRGVGLEIMASSDNVLRGGLTPKHVDAPELLRVLDTAAGPASTLAPIAEGPGVIAFVPPVPDFRLARVTIGGGDGDGADGAGGEAQSARVAFAGPAIALCLEGSLLLRGAVGEVRLAAGEAVFVTPDERELAFEGTGDVVIASTGIGPDAELPLP